MTTPGELESRFERMRQARLASKDAPQPYWKSDVAEPLAEWLRQEGGYASCSVKGPFGLMSRCLVSLANQGETPGSDSAASLVLQPIIERNTGYMRFGVVDLSRIVNEVAPGSIAEMNGMQFGAVAIPPKATAAEVLAMAGLEASATPRP